MTVKNTSNASPSSEHEEQRAFVAWWRKTQPDDIFAIPNGGKRGKTTAAKLKMEGATPGVWDLFVPARFLWIEFKRSDRGYLSAEQKSFGVSRLREGYRCIAAWGCDDAIWQIEHGDRREWKRIPK